MYVLNTSGWQKLNFQHYIYRPGMAILFEFEDHGNWKLSTKACGFNLGFLGSDVRDRRVDGGKS
jgi:hypothetical protein